MLMYVTLEDVLGGPGEGGPRPEPGPPPRTLSELYDRAMRHHVRKAALRFAVASQLEELPDWRLDRLVVRFGLYCRERLHLEAGDRLAVLGPLSWLWPVAEFATAGLGGVAVGLEAGLDETGLMQALAEAAPRVVVATDAAAGVRLLDARADSGVPEAVILAEDRAGASAPGAHALSEVLERGGILDTPERAQDFRTRSRSLWPDTPALLHFAASGTRVELTHRQALFEATRHWRQLPPRAGDVAYVQERRVTLTLRLALWSWIGDGRTTVALGDPDDAATLPHTVRPHALFASPQWIDRTWAEVEAASDGALRRLARAVPSLPLLSRLDRRGARVRRALAARLGDRLRCIESAAALAPGVGQALQQAGLSLLTGHWEGNLGGPHGVLGTDASTDR